MKATKKLLSFLGAAAMAASLVVLPGATEAEAKTADITATVTNAEGEVGDTVSVHVSLTSPETNMTGFVVRFHDNGTPKYDTSVLQFESVVFDDDLTDGLKSTAGNNAGYVTGKAKPFSSAGVTFNFKILKCTDTPITIDLANSVNGACEDVQIAAYDYEADTYYPTTYIQNLTTTITVKHPEASYQTSETPSTCIAQGSKTVTCGLCGAVISTESLPLTDHTWNDGEITKAATCTEKGVKTYTCTVCGETKTEEIAVTAHSWKTGSDTDADGWKIVTAATKDKEGSKERVCADCGEKETGVIAKLTDSKSDDQKQNDGKDNSGKDNSGSETDNKANAGKNNNSTGASGDKKASATESKSDSANTADQSSTVMYVILAAAAACLVAGTVAVKRRKGNQ